MFSSVLEDVYNRTGKVEGSFCSKLVATVNADKPVLDANVLASLELKKCACPYPEGRLRCTKMIYSIIDDWCSWVVEECKWNDWDTRFNRALPCYKHFSNIKKLDLFLWSHGMNRLSNKRSRG